MGYVIYIQQIGQKEQENLLKSGKISFLSCNHLFEDETYNKMDALKIPYQKIEQIFIGPQYLGEKRKFTPKTIKEKILPLLKELDQNIEKNKKQLINTQTKSAWNSYEDAKSMIKTLTNICQTAVELNKPIIIEE